MKNGFISFRTRAQVLAAFGTLALVALPASAQTTHTVCISGCNFTTIQAAVTAATAGDIVSVQAGTYTENVTIDKALTLSGAGIGQSVIVGTTAQAGEASVVIASGTDNVTLEGFTIEGFDRNNPGSENAAVYLPGTGQDNITIRNNRIVANGDDGLLSAYGGTRTGMTVTGNTFSGKTYVGAAPATGNQFTVPNVSRQLVVLGNGGSGTATESGLVFTGNTIDGDSGLNTLATLDVEGATITGNTFAGKTAGGSALRVRRGNGTIATNVFDTSQMSGAATLVMLQNQATTLGAFVAANTIDRAVYVDGAASGASYVGLSLLDGVTAAPASSTLKVVGTHVTGGPVDITKALTLEGDGAATTTIDTRGSSNYNIRVQTSNVTLRGFTLMSNSANYFGIKVEGSKKTPVEFKTENIVLDDVTVTGGRKTGVDISGVDGVTLTNVKVTGITNGRGIALTDVDNATLTGITTSGNAWGGISIATYGRYGPLGSSNVSITGLNASEINPIDFDMGNYANPAAPAMPTGFTGPAGFDAFTVKRPANGGFTLFSFTPSEANARTMGAASPGSAIVTASGDALVVPGMTVQAAIDAAAPGATITLGAGTYDGPVNVNKSVKIVGAGTDAATGTVLTTSSGAVVTLSASGTAPAPLTLQGLRIQAGNQYGINVGSGSVAHVLLDHVDVIGNNLSMYNEIGGTGLKVASAATLTDLTIRDSRFDNLQYGWYFAKDMPSTSGSTVDRVTVERTTFNHNAAKGIYAEKLSNASFTDVAANDNGWDTAFFNAKFNAGIDINLKGNDATYQNLSFTNLTATGNALGQQFGVGVTIKARTDGGSYGANPAALSGVTFTGGNVSGNEVGLRFGEPGKANPGPTGVTITGMTVTNNVSQWTGGAGVPLALVNASTAAIVAENNWWGTADPALVAARVVNTAGGSIDFTPFVGQAVASTVPVVNTPLSVASTPATFTFTTLPSNPQLINVAFEPSLPQNSSSALPDPAASIAGATQTLPATLTVTSGMANYAFRTTVSLDVSGVPGFGPNTRMAYYNTATNSYVPVEGTYAAGPPATYTFETDHFTTFVFYNGSAADPMNLYVSRTAAVPAAGEEFVTPNGTWSDLGSGADDWTYTGQTATFNVVPTFPATFDGLSAMHLVFAYNPSVLQTPVVTFNPANDWNVKTCQVGVPAAGQITCDMSLMGTVETATTLASPVLSVGFTVASPGYSVLDVIGAQVEKYNGAGGYTGVAATTHGGGVRNYLGDLTARIDASTTDNTLGDGKVDFDDLQVFGASYWAGAPGYTGSAVYLDKADIGPTTGPLARTVYGMPALDGKIDFEDLVIFGASYGLSARNVYPTTREGGDGTLATAQSVNVKAGDVRWEGDLLAIPVELSRVDNLRGGSFLLRLDGASGYEVVRARMPEALLGERSGLAFARAEAGQIRVDASVLGMDGVAGTGAVVEVLVRPTSRSLPTASVATADLRDGNGNRIDAIVAGTVASEATALPTVLALESVFPNPARARASVRVAVPQAQAVSVRVFDLLGREVMTVHDGELAAGRHDLAVPTDGLANGRYIVRMEAGAFSRVSSLTVLR